MRRERATPHHPRARQTRQPGAARPARMNPMPAPSGRRGTLRAVRHSRRRLRKRAKNASRHLLLSERFLNPLNPPMGSGEQDRLRRTTYAAVDLSHRAEMIGEVNNTAEHAIQFGGGHLARYA